MNDTVRAIFERADIDVDVLTHIPGTSIHEYMVKADAWLDGQEGLLMFVGARGEHISRFMYYIGEERNHDVEGVGRGIVAYRIDDDRVRWLRDRVRVAKSGAK
jgi:hypothetical protein